MKNMIVLFAALSVSASAFAQGNDFTGTTPDGKACSVKVDTASNGASMDITIDGYTATMSLGADNLPVVLDQSRETFQGLNGDTHLTVTIASTPATGALEAISFAINFFHGPAIRSCQNLSPAK